LRTTRGSGFGVKEVVPLSKLVVKIPLSKTSFVVPVFEHKASV